MALYTHDYSRDYQPSAPVVEVGLSQPESAANEIQLTAFLDTGADATLIPIGALRQTSARYVETLFMHGVANIRVPVDTYLVTVRIGPHTIHGIRAVAGGENAEAIVGRDVLNQLIVTLNGLAGVTQVSE